MTRTVTRLFDSYIDAENAVSDLERAGIPHDDISLIGSNAGGQHDHRGHDRLTSDAVHDGRSAGRGRVDADGDGDPDNLDDHGDVSRGATTGAVLGGVGGLLAGLGLLAIPGLGPVVAAGWLAATVTGAGVGAAGGAATGGLVGALKNSGEDDTHAHVYAEGVSRGGTLVSVRTDDARAAEAEAILSRHNAVDARSRGEEWRASGWNGSYSESERQRL